MVVAAVSLMRRQLDGGRLSEQLSPGPALSVLGGEDAGAEDTGPRAALFARIAVASATAMGSEEAPDAGTVVPAILEALGRGSTFEVRQLLITALAAELPAASSGRTGIAKAAAAVLLQSPVMDAAEALLGQGAFPDAHLGGPDEVPPHTIPLAMLVLRRVAGDGSDSRDGVRKTADEAWFSRAAGSAMNNMLEALDTAAREAASLRSDAAVAREESEEARWEHDAPSPGGGVATVALSLCRRREADIALRKAEAAAAAANAVRDERCLRAVLAACGWLQHSRAPLSKDAAQSDLLDSVLRPALRSPELGHTTRVAAVMAIAVYASKSQEDAVAHWPFFIGLLEAHLPKLKSPAATGSADSSPLCVAARLAEISVLFLCDSLVLHRSALAEQHAKQAFSVLAKVIMALDAAGPEGRATDDLSHLRTVLADRTCHLAIMGCMPLGGSAAQWLLGHLLLDVCGGAVHSTAAFAGDEDTRLAHAVACGRTLRFLAMLPLMSPMHAQILVDAAEAFFGARMWMTAGHSVTRMTPAVRAARLVCTRLRLGASAHGCSAAPFASLQLRVVKAVAAALLTAPAGCTTTLCDALAAAVLASAGGEAPLSWADSQEAPALAEALSSLLGRDWQPQTSAKAVEALLRELSTHCPAADAGWQWAQGSLDRAADLRHDLSTMGLPTGPTGLSLGGGSPTRSYRVAVSRQQSTFYSRFGSKAQAAAESPTSNRQQTLVKAAAESPTSNRRKAAMKSRQATASEATAESPTSNRRQTRQPMETPPKELPRVRSWHLVESATGNSKQLPANGQATTLGRKADCDFVVNEPAVSGRHCTLSCTEAGVVLRDLGGTNCTYVDGIRMDRSGYKVLQAGAVITLAASKGPSFTLRADLCPQVLACISARGAAGADSADDALHAAAYKRRRLAEEQKPHSVPSELSAAAVAGIEEKDRYEKTLSSCKLARTAFSERAAADVACEGGESEDDEAAVEKTSAEALPDETCKVPRLVELDGGKVHRLPHNGVISLGRRLDCEVSLKSTVISGRHCVLTIQEGCVEVEDVSTNGTFLNDTRVPKGACLPQRVPLHNEDRLALALRDGPALLFLDEAQADDEEARKKAVDEAARKQAADEEAKQEAAEQEARRMADAEAKRKAAVEAEAKNEKRAKTEAEERVKRKADAEARSRAEAEAENEKRVEAKAEKRTKRKADAEAESRTEAEVKKRNRAEEEAQRLAEDESNKQELVHQAEAKPDESAPGISTSRRIKGKTGVATTGRPKSEADSPKSSGEEASQTRLAKEKEEVESVERQKRDLQRTEALIAEKKRIALAHLKKKKDQKQEMPHSE
eukprot:gnl/TRDRNA2_/TRDRNA2_136839_c0_seq1.p1 gnl/TRDRNA2_/TRDRNA2_136839_c0~~gnl/TRDRNA2_/TRDRNA2_136839_c0_seq1.p1  ORF type:complete len:1328 (-),score=308.10 gnl/TRDRNA2_/TRDRNA2_136839_c0_seq1:70-4053(-)